MRNWPRSAPDSAVLNSLASSGSLNPSHVASSGCSSTTNVGTYQPIFALGPRRPRSTTDCLPVM
jgi:hypothetical protein